MDMIQLKIRKDSNILKYIRLIRKFDSSLSVGAVKQRIENNEFVLAFDLEYYDVLEDINGIDKKESFCSLIEKLCLLEAKVMIEHDGEPVSLRLLVNWLITLKEIEHKTERDMESELGEQY